MRFNLTSEPWIPCERGDGTVVELSTTQTLAQAHELRAIVASSPLEVAAIHRHLLAVVHRAHEGPRSMAEWVKIGRLGKFDQRVEGYLERVADRMDLFHADHPFAQTRGLVEKFGTTPIDALGVERSPWGAARELFQHRDPNAPVSMTPAEAARALLAHQAFSTGGLVKKPGEPTSATAAPLTKAAMVLLRGKTLFETLLANLLVYDPGAGKPFAGSEEDAPAWEQEPPPRRLNVAKEPKAMPKGWLDLLTWLSRRIELVEEQGMVTAFVRAVGKGLDEGFDAIGDPMIAYRLDAKRGFVPIGIHPTRAFWRNASALFESNREGARYRRPKSVELVSSPEVQDVLREDVGFSVELFGIAAYQSRVDDMRTERVYAHARLFDDPYAFESVNEALSLAEDAAGVLRHALKNGYARYLLSAGDRQPDAKDISALTKSLGAESAAFAELGRHFDRFLRLLAVDPQAAVAEFRDAVQRTIRDGFEVATSAGDHTGASLKARAMGERLLNMGLSKLKNDEHSADVAPEVRA